MPFPIRAAPVGAGSEFAAESEEACEPIGLHLFAHLRRTVLPSQPCLLEKLNREALRIGKRFYDTGSPHQARLPNPAAIPATNLILYGRSEKGR
jgi:hypothetical protein